VPYTSSVAWRNTGEGYTPMRALVVDFRDDPRTWNIGDQFLFGPSILVNPVTEPGATTRHIYLPNGKWYNFWTNESIEGGRSIDVPSPLDQMPLFVRAGAILPLGPQVEYATQDVTDKPHEIVHPHEQEEMFELRVYMGADGDFTLYEDDGNTYAYEKGQFATIPLHWNESAQKLTLGERKGTYPGMLRRRHFGVSFVRKSSRSPEMRKSFPMEITYDGHPFEVAFTETPGSK